MTKDIKWTKTSKNVWQCRILKIVRTTRRGETSFETRRREVHTGSLHTLAAAKDSGRRSLVRTDYSAMGW